MDGAIIVGVVAVLFGLLVRFATKGTPQQKMIAIGVMILIIGAFGVVIIGPVFFAVIALLGWAAYNYLDFGNKGPPSSR